VPPEYIDEDFTAFFKTNVISIIHLINLALPLIRAGNKKKVLVLSSSAADDELIRRYDDYNQPAYAVSKAAANSVVAKYSAAYADEGILFLTISPGVVDTGMPTGRLLASLDNLAMADGRDRSIYPARVYEAWS
jgi:NAD(P)-dependent dehydrogenase (short-subunit alcohol dehydrogenase family)